MVENLLEYYTKRILEELSKYGIKPIERDPERIPNSLEAKRIERVHKEVADYSTWLDKFEDPSRQGPRRVRFSLA